MSPMTKIAGLCLCLAMMVASFGAVAQSPTSLACSVTVDYVFTAQDGSLLQTEPYQRDFVVQTGVDFVDDFSTPTRLKRLTASAIREGGSAVVAINYFNDVGVFNAIDLSTSLVLSNGRAADATAGRHRFSTTLAAAGHHTTTYSLSCRRI